MKKTNIKKKAACAGLIVLSALSVSGCQSKNLERVNALPAQNYKTMQELMDEGKEALQYTNFSQRGAVTDYKAQFNGATEENQKRCLALLQTVLAEHSRSLDAVDGEDESKHLNKVSRENYDYLKAVLDDLQLGNAKAQTIKEFSGYYFVTVEFDTKANSLGSFRNYANYVGLDNCIIRKPVDEFTSVDAVDPNWISQITRYLNNTRDENNQLPVFTIDSGTEVSVPIVTEPEPIIDEQAIDTETGSMIDGDAGTATVDIDGLDTEETEPEYIQQAVDTGTDAGDNGTYEAKKAIGDQDIYSENLRKMMIDVNEYESLFGASSTTIAYFPELGMVYQPTKADKDWIFAGNGCYNEGTNGLREFGFDRNNMNGKMQITFVFSQDEINKDELNYIFPYIEAYESSYDFGYDSYINVPNFVEEQLRIKIEEYDRLVNNNDINGLMEEYTIEDAGLAFRSAEYGNSSIINQFSTKYLGCVARSNSAYLVKAERTVAESPKYSELVSQYKEEVYYVIRQKALDFYINDMWVARRELTKQPSISEISLNYRQLVAQNLSGEVSDAQKAEVTTELFDKLEDYTTRRVLGSREEGDDKLEGIKDLFQPSSVVLSDDSFDYLSARIMNNAVRRGSKTKANLTVVPVEWVGGYDTQVEVITKELFEYEDGTGLYLENYYVLSHFGSRWVIDDIQQIIEKEYEGAEFQSVKANFDSTGRLDKVIETTLETTD